MQIISLSLNDYFVFTSVTTDITIQGQVLNVHFPNFLKVYSMLILNFTTYPRKHFLTYITSAIDILTTITNKLSH